MRRKEERTYVRLIFCIGGGARQKNAKCLSADLNTVLPVTVVLWLPFGYYYPMIARPLRHAPDIRPFLQPTSNSNEPVVTATAQKERRLMTPSDRHLHE
jgi:hypothetical protein